MLVRRAAQASFDTGERAQSRIDELESLSHDYSNSVFSRRKELSKAIKNESINDEKLLATFDDEFVVLMQDLRDGSGQTNVRLYVPSSGQHRIRIEIWLNEKRRLDDFFDVESGKRYDIEFGLTNDAIEISFPPYKSFSRPLRNFDFQPGSKILGRPPLFVSPNQPPWRKGIAFFDESRTGVLSEFRFSEKTVPELFDPVNALSVRVSAESKGPMSAAADDPLTITRLMEMAAGLRKAMPYRYENGRYIFE